MTSQEQGLRRIYQSLERHGLVESIGRDHREWFGKPDDGVPLRELRQRAKMQNFGSPVVPSLATAELIYLWCWMLVEQAARKQYADERELPEYVDIGGES